MRSHSLFHNKRSLFLRFSARRSLLLPQQAIATLVTTQGKSLGKL
ncbi:hypothetical protein [Nostoc sp.]